MRTTLTLDVEVAQQVKALAREKRKSMRKVINDLLRKGLAGNRKGQRPGRFQIKSFKMGWRGEIDPGRLNQLYDQLEAEISIGKMMLHEPESK